MARDLDVGFTVFANTQPAVQPMVRLNTVIKQTDAEMLRFGNNLKRRSIEQQQRFAGAIRGSAFALAGTAAALLKTAATAGDYDRQIRLAGFLTKNTGEDFAAFDAGVKTISGSLGILPTEIARAGQAVGRLGFRGQASLGILESSATLAAASLGELTGEGAVGAIGTALRSFGQGAESAAATADALTNSVNNTSLNFKKLPLALGTSAGFAAAFGANLNELLGLLGAANDVIPRTERAATGVRNIFRDLSHSATIAKLASAGLTLQTVDAAGKFRGIVPILSELFAQTEKMTESQRLQALQTGFSVEAATALAALQERLKTGFVDANGAIVRGTEGLAMLIQSMGNSGSASDLAQEKLKGFAGAMDKFKTQGSLLAIELGKALSTVLVPALNFVTGLITDFKDALASASPVTKTIIGVLGTAAIVLGIVGGVLIAASLAMGGWASITGLATEANLAFLASLGPIALILGAIVASVVLFWGVIKRIYAALIKFRAFVLFRSVTDEEQKQIDELEGKVTDPKTGERVDAPASPTSVEGIRAAIAAANAPLQPGGGGAAPPRSTAAPGEPGSPLLAPGEGAQPGDTISRDEINVRLEMDGTKMGEALIERRRREARRTFRPARNA